MARRIQSLDELRRPPTPQPSRLSPQGASTVRILGIDPGSRYTGWGVIEATGARLKPIAAGRINATLGSMPERLLKIADGLAEVIAEHAPQEVAIEETFVNRANAQSALVLGQARGVALLAAARSGALIAEYAAAEVKLAIAGNGRADKQQVQYMVRALLKLKDALAEDAADALAVALCHAHRRRSPL